MKTITIYPSKTQLVCLIPLCGAIIVRLGFVAMDPEYFGPAADPVMYAVDGFILLVLLGLLKHLHRVFTGGPALIIDENGIYMNINLLYGALKIRWEDIQDIHAATYKSPREIKYRSLKIVPRDYAAFMSGFSPPKRVLIWMATVGAGKMIDIPQVMIGEKVEDILAEIELLRKNA